MDDPAVSMDGMTDDRPLPFAGCSGKGVRIAVIDSGVHPDHPHIRADTIEPGILVLADGTIEDGADAILDRLGHGTAVTAAIQEKAPDVQSVPIRVFRDALKTSSAALIAAMRWAITQEVDIINLSLGSMNEAHRGAFAAVADEAAEAGVLLVAAREANDVLCYPGAVPGVLGIQLDWDCPRERYRAVPGDEALALFAAGYPRPIPGVALRRNFYGISFAVAQMSGFAALACEQLGGWGSELGSSPYTQAARALLGEARA
jgi:subtilisin family serine protease